MPKSHGIHTENNSKIFLFFFILYNKKILLLLQILSDSLRQQPGQPKKKPKTQLRYNSNITNYTQKYVRFQS